MAAVAVSPSFEFLSHGACHLQSLVKYRFAQIFSDFPDPIASEYLCTKLWFSVCSADSKCVSWFSFVVCVDRHATDDLLSCFCLS